MFDVNVQKVNWFCSMIILFFFLLTFTVSEIIPNYNIIKFNMSQVSSSSEQCDPQVQ